MAEGREHVGANDVVSERVNLGTAIIVGGLKRGNTAYQRRPNINVSRVIVGDEPIANMLVRAIVGCRRVDDGHDMIAGGDPVVEIRKIIGPILSEDDIVSDVRHDQLQRMQEGVFGLAANKV